MSKIETCDIGWHPAAGCNKGCKYCWARRMIKRIAHVYAKNEMRLQGITERQKIKAKEEEIASFKPIWLESNFIREFPKKQRKIAMGWMSDISYWKNEWTGKVLDKIFDNNEYRIGKELKPHVFQFLTKDIFFYNKLNFPLNCWLGITITNETDIQKLKDYIKIINETGYWRNYPHTKYLYIEPMLGKVNIDGLERYVDWVVVGGQSGPGAQPLNPDWVRPIRDQCVKNNIAFFFKQWGEYYPYWDPYEKRWEFNRKPKGHKGNVLDGKKWEQFPPMPE